MALPSSQEIHFTLNPHLNSSMKTFCGVPARVLVAIMAAAAVWPARLAAVENVTDAIQVVRSVYSSERQAVLAEAMQLTESQSAAFWPLYRQYRADQEKIGDSLVKLVLEYADVYPNVPEERAGLLLKGYTSLEEKLAHNRARYLKKFSKILPATKALLFAQIEARMDLALRLQLATGIPLVPGTKKQ